MMKSFTIYDCDLDPFIRAHLYAALSDGFIPYWITVKIDGRFVRYEKNAHEKSVTFYYEEGVNAGDNNQIVRVGIGTNPPCGGIRESQKGTI